MTVLAEPIRSNYATDSAAMMGKAIKLIEAAKVYENRQCTHKPSREKNPIGKPWGMQADGDLWEQVWQAILKRGAANQQIRKVKGHATSEDVQAGRSTVDDKTGNDKSDANADKGVQSIAGDGLVCLAGWVAKRQAAYKQFIARIHRYIAAITIIEKEERAKAGRIRKALLGYDAEKWIKSNGKIRKETQETITFQKLNMPPPTKGRHKFAHCQRLYEEVRNFLEERRWAPARQDCEAGGITWIELFILFDTAGKRSEQGRHVKSEAAQKRAKARKSKEKKQHTQDSSAVVKPSLEEEIKLFKAVCRYIFQNDLQAAQTPWFRMEKRIDRRRLADLGVDGCCPALAVYCETTAAEDEAIARAVLQQKVGANRKAIDEHDKSKQPAHDHPPLTILYKKARIAYGATVKWKRFFAQGGPHARSENEASLGDAQSENEASLGESPMYASRLINCMRCQAAQETKWMQLRTREGFRAIHCYRCRLQQRCSRNTCQCGKVWHHCLIHRNDPPTHRSKKAPKMTSEEKARKQAAEQAEGEQANRKKRKSHDKFEPPQVKEHSEAIKMKKGKGGEGTGRGILTSKQ